MRFRALIEQAGKTATGFEVPVPVVEGLGAGKRPLVRVTINGFTYRSTVASMGGRFMIGVSAENRAAANVGGGDVVEVNLELDTAPREVAVPKDLAAALKKDARAKATFHSLSNSNKAWHVQSVEGAETGATRQRRIARSIASLRESKPR